MNSIAILEKEAFIITRYLINHSPSKKAVDLYIEAHQKQSIEITGKEKKRWNIAMRFPFLLQFIDAGYALRRRPSALRKKILLMFAVLESLPEYAHYFLPKKNQTVLLTILSTLLKTTVRTGIGVLLLWIL